MLIGDDGAVEDLPSAVEAAADLSAVLGSVKRGALRMFGDWFGRPVDNVLIADSVKAEGHDLIVGFGDGEELVISDPAEWAFAADTFRVGRASRVIWRWYYYGRPKEPANLLTIEHWFDESGVLRARSDADWSLRAFGLSSSEPAAELLSVL